MIVSKKIMSESSDDVIETSTAFANRFFEVANPLISVESTIAFIRNWFPITRAFALALPAYTALMAERLKHARGADREALEAGMIVPLAICAGEYGVAMPSPGIHYLLFAELAEPFGVSVEDLLDTPRGTTPETAALVDAVEDSLRDLAKGAACIRVVEKTAFNIVYAMNKIFRPLRAADGKPLLSKEQMAYISMHLVIEKVHEKITVDFVDLLRRQDSAFAARMDREIERLCGMFGEFWEAQAALVFGDLTTRPKGNRPRKA